MAEFDNARNLLLGGFPLTLSRRDAWPFISHERLPSEEGDQLPKRWYVPFGYLGMGSSLPAVPGQHDYTLDTDTYSNWDELAPGLLHAKMGLALDNPVAALAVATPSATITGPTITGTVAEDAGIGTTAWLNPTNAQASDNSDATNTVTASSISRYLKCTNFGFAIPTGDSVEGVVVHVEGDATGTGLNLTLNVRLVIGGTIQTGTTRSTSFNHVGETTISVGDIDDLFGQASISESQAENSGFGAAIYFTNANAINNASVAIDAVSITLYHSSGSSTTKFIYIGAGDDLIKRSYALSGTTPTFSTIQSKNFTHQRSSAAPSISDITVPKNGKSPFDAKILIGFGDTAGIQQVNAISSTGNDTYQLADGVKETTPAYAGYFTIAAGQDNAQANIYKSTASFDQDRGPYSRMQSSAIDFTANKNFGVESAWVPATDDAYPVGNSGASMTSLANFQTGVVVGKPEGLFTFDEAAGFLKFMAFDSYESAQNGRELLPWQQSLLALTIQDLIEYPSAGDANVGISTLLSNLSPIQGIPTAIASFGRFLYVVYYDGTDSYLVLMRRRGAEDVPHEYIIHGLTKLTGANPRTMLVATDGSDNVWLFYGTASATPAKYDVGYTVLDPISKRRYASGGEWRSTRQGEPSKLTVIDRIIGYGVSCDANNFWTITCAWDEGSFTAIGAGAVINTNGRNVEAMSVGTNDRGYQFQFKAVCTTNSSANRPRLRSFNSQDLGAGGLVVEGSQQAGYIDRFVVAVDIPAEATTGYGGEMGRSGQPEYPLSSLVALQGTTVPVIWQDYYGDTTARTARVERVSVRSPDGQEHHAQRQVLITFRVLVVS